MFKVFLISGAALAFLSVALGAFGAHSLKGILSDYGSSIWEKAVFYHIIHALALLLTGILQNLFKTQNFNFTGYAFIAGIVLFSGSLYILAITQIKTFGIITPFGGLSFLAGWAALIYNFVKLN